ncbi:MAG: MFS transporter [Armatimonadota bacterium]
MVTSETPARPRSEVSSGYRWVVLGVGTLGVFAALGLARFGYSTVLPEMQRNLHFTNTGAGIIATANLTGYLVMAVIGGALASRFGSRIVGTVGLLLVTLGMAFTGAAGGFLAVCAWRAVTGVGTGLANMAIMGMWPAWFGSQQRGRAAGIAVAGSSLALMVTGPVVPYILESFPATGWRACWYLFALASGIIALLGWALLRDRPATAAVAVQPAFEKRNSLWTCVYRSPAMWLLGAIYTAFGFSYIIYLTFFVKYLVGERDYSAPAAGQLFLLMGVCTAFSGFIWGAVSDFFGRRTALVSLFLIHMVAYALFALSGGRMGLLASAVLFGLSAWSIPAIMAATCGDMVGARLSAAGLGFVTLFFGIGQALGPSVAGALADAFESFAPAFLLAAAFALVGAMASLLLPGRQQERTLVEP